MTLTQLRAFVAAFELGSFTRAAKSLSTTQASVSELVARLEREVGMKLFVRGPRSLVPTEAAKQLRDHALDAITAIETGMGALNAMTTLDGGVCTFGVFNSAAYYNLSDLVQRFHAHYPNIRVRMVGLNSALVAESIASGELEAGLIVLPVPEQGLKVKPLVRDELVFASAARDAAAGPMTVAELASRRLVLYDAYAGWRDPMRRQLLGRAQLEGLRLEPVIEVEHLETALNLVATGAVDTVVSRTVAESSSFARNVQIVPFSDPLYDTIALAQRDSVALSPATRRFAQLAERAMLSKVYDGATEPHDAVRPADLTSSRDLSGSAASPSA